MPIHNSNWFRDQSFNNIQSSWQKMQFESNNADYYVYSTTINNIEYLLLVDEIGWEIKLTACYNVVLNKLLKSGTASRLRDSKYRCIKAFIKLVGNE